MERERKSNVKFLSFLHNFFIRILSRSDMIASTQSMQKDFQEWHGLKTRIENTSDARVFFHDREVWWASIGANVGFEQDGKGVKFARPILVFKKFNKEVLWELPLSMRLKKGKFYASIELDDGLVRVAIISQLRLMDSKRLIDKIGIIDATNYADIQKAVINLCSL